MNKVLGPFYVIVLGLCSCQNSEYLIDNRLFDRVETLPSIEGNPDYLNSPYVTAGDRVYMVGYQNGQFPDMGWHVQGEMGGIWDHPIKLMDGFQIQISNQEGQSWCLEESARFLNYPMANKHIYSKTNGLTVERFQFVPDSLEGLIIEFTLQNQTMEAQNIEFTFTGQVDLRPVWLAEKRKIEDGQDEASWDAEHQAMISRDSRNDWFVVFGSSQNPTEHQTGPVECSTERKGNGLDASLVYSAEIGARQQATIPFFVAGSYKSQEEALHTFDYLKANAVQLLDQKIQRYQAIKETADIDIPDQDIQEQYTWTKYNTDWLMRNVPEIGKGLSAGLPDYPWWFGVDNCYALQGVYAIGQPGWAKSTMELIHELSATTNPTGRIVHETSTNGVVYNPGNLNETPHFAILVWKMYQWTGDDAFLRELYPTVQKGLEWLSTEMDQDQNLYPDGEGIMEIHGLSSEMIDVVVYTQQAYQAAAEMAYLLGDSDLSAVYAERAAKLKVKINSEWWVASAQSYADFIATTEKTLGLIDDAIIRADTIDKPWAIEELKMIRQKVKQNARGLKQGQVVHHNWVVNTPMEMGVAEPGKAHLALQTGSRYTNKFGVYVTGIDRDENVSETTKWKSFSYVGAVMTLPTGVQAIGECNYGNPDGALGYLKMLHNSFSYALPGSTYEVSPDYGMITQAWTIYSVAVPIVNHFFGIKPRAYEQTIAIAPAMPTAWDNARIRNVRVGDNVLSFEKKKNQSGFTYILDQEIEDWTLEFYPDSAAASVQVNGNTIIFHAPITLTGKHNEIIVSTTTSEY